MRVVVAGAGGFVGGRLVQHLEAIGANVTPLVRTPRPWLPASQRALDLRRPSVELAAALDGADAVVHLAGPSEVHATSHPEQVLADTVAISSVLGTAAAAAGIGRLVYLSTVHVYGARVVPGAVLTEDLRCEPRHPYAVARLASEHVLAALGLPLTVLRLTNSVGAPAAPGVDRWSLVVNDLCRQAVLQHSVELQTDGTQWRDFVSLGDAIDVIARLCDGPVVPGTWNLGSGRPATVREVAGLVQTSFEALAGERPALVAPAPRDAPAEPPLVDVSGLGGRGFGCPTPLAASVAEVVRFCLEHRTELTAPEPALRGAR